MRTTHTLDEPLVAHTVQSYADKMWCYAPVSSLDCRASLATTGGGIRRSSDVVRFIDRAGGFTQSPGCHRTNSLFD